MTDPNPPAAKAPPVIIAGRDLLVALALSLLTVAVFVAITYGLAMMVARHGGGSIEALGLASGFAAYAGMLAAVWFAAVRQHDGGWGAVGLRRCEPSFLILGGVAALLWVAVSAALYSATGMWREALADGRSLFEPYMHNPLLVVAMLVLAGPVAALAEEVAFRGMFYGWLRGYMAVAPAALISSLFFTAAHFYVYVAGIPFFVEMLALSVLLALLFELSRSLWPGILCHAINNLTVLSLYLLQR